MATPRTVAFQSLGCNLNFAETSSVRRLFENDGYTIVHYEDEADVYVLNTCSVTDNADRECRKAVRLFHRLNPQARIIVMGCYAQLKPNEIAGIEGVHLVLGAAEKFQVLEFLHALEGLHDHATIHAGEIQLANTFHTAHSQGDRTRSFLKVQDGCDYKCTFCTIPKARGKSRSAPIEEILRQARQIGLDGIHEIVLTGVNIGDFGNGTSVIEGQRPKKEAMLLDLITALDEISEISRFRISSIEPNLCTNEIIAFVAASKRFMPHFHMPLQSGNNDILRLMKRRYQRELYAERVETIRRLIPHACIGVDVITGFPGETDEHFANTYSFLRALDIDYIHAFTYSERKDTPAAAMDGAVPISVRRQRSQTLRKLSLLKKQMQYQRHLGEARPVLFEKGLDEHTLSGYTDNYIRITMPGHESLINTLSTATLQKIKAEGNDILVAASL